MTHIVLLGDSIFDNDRYVPGGPAVIEQLRQRLGSDDKATLLAVDGNVTDQVEKQLTRLPAEATHLIVSVGGNDALGHSHILNSGLSDKEFWAALGAIHADFGISYHQMLAAVLARGKPTAVCTIYDFIPDLPRAAVTALTLFNDVILRTAFRRGVPVIDLRLICTERSDYSGVSPIEPSRLGGAKIVAAIGALVDAHDFGRGRTIVYR